VDKKYHSGDNISFTFTGTDCLGDHSNGTGQVVKKSSGTDLPEFWQTDLIGTWTGTASNLEHSATLGLTVTSAGEVSGTGVSSTWTIDPMGIVIGGGTFTFISGTQLIIASASWNLQLNGTKDKLTGIYDVFVPGLHDLDITLVRQ
jgi:hypothetical protein